MIHSETGETFKMNTLITEELDRFYNNRIKQDESTESQGKKMSH